ncbi:MAG: hypothetical protein AAGF24_12310 [Cyanobacteria bacterium P01_H01_bin.121]
MHQQRSSTSQGWSLLFGVILVGAPATLVWLGVGAILRHMLGATAGNLLLLAGLGVAFLTVPVMCKVLTVSAQPPPHFLWVSVVMLLGWGIILAFCLSAGVTLGGGIWLLLVSAIVGLSWLNKHHRSKLRAIKGSIASPLEFFVVNIVLRYIAPVLIMLGWWVGCTIAAAAPIAVLVAIFPAYQFWLWRLGFACVWLLLVPVFRRSWREGAFRFSPLHSSRYTSSTANAGLPFSTAADSFSSSSGGAGDGGFSWGGDASSSACDPGSGSDGCDVGGDF